MKAALFLLLFTIQLSFGQSSHDQIDSLSRELQIQKGKELVLAQISLASLIMTIDIEQSDSLLAVSMSSSLRSDFMEGRIRTILVQAAVANYRNRFDKSRELLVEAIDLSRANQFEEGLAYAYTTLGSQLLRQASYAEAIDNHFKGASYAKELEMPDVEVTNLLNIGLIKQRIGELDESEKYLRQAIEICDKEGLDFRQAQLWVNLGVLEFSRQNVGLSVDYNERALALFQSLGDKQYAAQCLQNIGFAYASMKKRSESFSYYDRAIAMRQETGDQAGIARIMLNKGKLERELGQLAAATHFGEQAIDMLSSSRNPRLLTDIYQFMSEVYQVQNKHALALEYYKKYAASKDSLQASINETKIAALTSQFEFDKQERALKMANKETELLRSRQLIFILAIVALLTVMVVIFLATRQKMARQKMERQMVMDQVRISQLQEDKLSQELALKKMELSNFADQLKQKNQIISDVHVELEILKTEEQKRLVEYGLKSLSEGIENRSGSVISWEEFRLKFDAVHKDYVKDLVSKHDGLTKNEIDLCILMKVNLTHKDISHILNIEYDSVKKSIQRLFRKLGFNTSDELRAHLLKI